MSDLPQIINEKVNFDAIKAMVFDEKARELQNILPTHVPLERAQQNLLNAMNSTPKLRVCSPISIWNSLTKSCSLGLELNGPLGEAYMIPYSQTAQLIIGYKGWIQLCRNTGMLMEIVADVVYRSEVESGLCEITRAPPDVRHALDLLGDRESQPDTEIVGAYAMFAFKDGGRSVSWVPRSTLDARAQATPQNPSGRWANTKEFPDRWRGMARKTAILQAFHRREVPVSHVIANALEQEEEVRQADWQEVQRPTPPVPTITGPEEFTSREDQAQKAATEQQISLEEAQAADAAERANHDGQDSLPF